MISALANFVSIKKYSFVKIIIPLIFIMLIAILAASIFIPKVIENNIIKNTKSDSAQKINQFKILRKYYTQNVIKPILTYTDLKPSYTHKNNPKEVPLPATMIHDLGEIMQKHGMSLSLYSGYPFPNRADRSLTAFQSQAWQYLQKNPDQPYTQVKTTADGKTLLYYAIADKMVSQVCVTCHNNHASTPKNDWKLGDVRGVLETVTDISAQIASGQAIAAGMMAALFIMLIVIALSLFIIYKNIVLKQLKYIINVFKQIANGKLDNTIPLQQQDEFGIVKLRLNDMQNQLSKHYDERQQQHLYTLRVKSALDFVNQNVMLADVEHTIIYINHSLQNMFDDNQQEFKKHIAAFDSHSMIGTNMNLFQCMNLFNNSNEDLTRSLTRLTQPLSTKITLGELHLYLIITPVFDDSGQRAGTATEWQNITLEVRRQAIEKKRAKEVKMLAEVNGRIKVALDRVSRSVMLTDKDYNIIYINDSLQKIFDDNETDIQQTLKQFNASQVLGKNIDFFHRQPDNQRKILDGLTTPYLAKLQLGELYIDLTISPVFDQDGQRTGTVAEWGNVSAERRVEKEVNQVIHAVSEGDLEAVICTADKTGFYLNLAEAFNKVTQINRQVFSEAITVMQALSRGQLNARMEGQYQGSFAELKQYINNTVGHLTNAIGDTVSVLEAISKGDLTHRIHNNYEGVFKDLQNYVNLTTEHLTTVIQQIHTGSQSVSAASGDITTGNNSLNQRTQEQVAVLEKISVSMEEISTMVTQTSRQSEQASALFQQAQSCAKQGHQVVDNAINAMQLIESSSKEILTIINVIDEIAFQTNLLALNAAVEAARAGEQGRGFAVVATEVRNLAQRSALSAKEIKELIKTSVANIEDGAKLVTATGTSLNEIVGVIHEVSSTVTEINSASQDQAIRIKEINNAVMTMDQKTQANNSLVNQLTELGESLDKQSNHLFEIISFFSLNYNNNTDEHTLFDTTNNASAIDDNKHQNNNNSASKDDDKDENQDGQHYQ